MSELREYRVDVHHETDHVWAEVIDLPGCFASGQDEDELREALAEAIGMWLSDKPGHCRVVELELESEPAVAHSVARAQLQPA